MCGAVARLGARRLRVEFAAHLHGLGYSRVEAHVPALGLRTRPFVLATPVDGASIDLRLALRAADLAAAAHGSQRLPPVLVRAGAAVRRPLPALPAREVMQPEGRFFVVEGGVGRYIARLVEALPGVDLRPATPVSALRRSGAQIEVVDGEGRARGFDRVVLATESPVAAALAAGLAGAEATAAALARFRTCDDYIVVHSDERLMPRDRGDWSVVNVRHEGHRAVLTEWSGMDQDAPVFRSFSAREPVAAERVHRVEAYKHPIVTPQHYAVQREFAALQGAAGLWAAGLYTRDVDNHESALVSAMRVAEALAPGSANLRALAGERPTTRAA